MLARRADFVPLSNMSNLVHFVDIHRQRGQTFVAPSYHVLSLYRRAVGSRPLASTIRTPMYDVREGNRRVSTILDVPFVDALSVLSAGNNMLRVYVVNRSLDTAYPVTIDLDGFTVVANGRAECVSADSLSAANTPENPDRIGVRPVLYQRVGNQIRYVAPSHSVGLIELRRR